MIARNSRTLFGGRITEIHTPAFRCVVSTERQGAFGRLATVIIDSEMQAADMGRSVCGRISYQPDLGKAEIHDLHATIVATINEGGRRGIPLGVALQDAIDYLSQKGLASETINTAPGG